MPVYLSYLHSSACLVRPSVFPIGIRYGLLFRFHFRMT